MPARTVPFKLVYLLRIDARGRIECTVHRARILNPDAVREAITGKLTNLLREKERDYLDPIRKAFRAGGLRFSATGGPAYGWQVSGFRLPALPMSRY